jgi:hypothetical protein
MGPWKHQQRYDYGHHLSFNPLQSKNLLSNLTLPLISFYFPTRTPPLFPVHLLDVHTGDSRCISHRKSTSDTDQFDQSFTRKEKHSPGTTRP